MQRLLRYSTLEICLAAGFAGLLAYPLYATLTSAMLTFVNALPWNP